MPAEDSVEPPGSWSKYGEIYTNEKHETVFICSICPERVNSFADFHSLWNHFGIEHRERLQVPDATNVVNIAKEVPSDSVPVKREPKDECEDSDIHKELNNEPLANVSNADMYIVQPDVITILDSDDEDNQQECPQGISVPQGVEAPQQSNNPQNGIVIQNCTIITNDTRQTPSGPSIRHELYQAPNRPCESQVASGNTPAEQDHRENISSGQITREIIQGPQINRDDIPAKQNNREDIPAQQNNRKKIAVKKNNRQKIPAKQNRSKQKRTKKTAKRNPSKIIIKQKRKATRPCTRLIKCNIHVCGRGMKTELTYWKHNVELHTIGVNSNKRRCSICLELVLKEEFKQHQRQHSRSTRHHCTRCQELFFDQDKLLWHYVKYHKILEENTRHSLVPPRSI